VSSTGIVWSSSPVAAHRDADAAASAMPHHVERGKQATIDHLRAIGAPET
jgi:hypothetical protein